MGQIPIANGFYQSESLPVSNQRCVNLYPVVPQAPALSESILVGTPGIVQLATTGVVQEINRGAKVKNKIAYFVNGTTLYSFIRTLTDNVESFSTTSLGTIPGTGRVSMANSPTQLMILVPGGKAYIYNESDGTPFQEITDADFRANGEPMYVVYIDGYFVCTTDENKVISSSLNDGLAWSALDFGSAESDPDYTVAPVVTNNQLYITGEITTEEFRNIGGTGFPFQRTNVFLDKGCSAPFSIIKANQTFFMVGKGESENVAVWKFMGTEFNRVSTDAIDVLLQNTTDEELEACFAMYYSSKGDYFVSFTFAQKTLLFDLVTEKWHERESLDDESTVRWRVNSLISAYSRTLVGDSVDGRIGSLSESVYDEYGEDIRSFFTIQPFFGEEGVALPKLEMTMESGVGNVDAPDPKVSMAISKDGKTFGSERVRSMGMKGQYNRRIVWRRNGRADRFMVLRYACSDKVKKVFIRLDAK